MLKKLMITSFVALSLALAVSSASYAEGAPFGLTWGLSSEQLSALGIALEQQSDENGLKFFRTGSLPKNLSVSESYGLIISSSLGLQKIIMVSKDIDGDIYGSDGKETYFDFKAKLIEKYGAPTNELEQVGLSVWDDPDEFYQCLAYEGCGAWISIFRKDGIAVGLELEGLGRGKGFIKITYEGPKWTAVTENARNVKSAADEEAL